MPRASKRKWPLPPGETDDDGFGACVACSFVDKLQEGLCPDCYELEVEEFGAPSEAELWKWERTW